MSAAYDRVNPFSSGIVLPPEAKLEDFFPMVESGHTPLGARLLLQLRGVKKMSSGGIALVTDTQDTEIFNTQIGQVRKVGPMSFRDRTTMVTWPEGAWVEEGDFVRIGRYIGDRWSIKHGDMDVIFVLVSDHEIMAKVTDPLAVRAFIA